MTLLALLAANQTPPPPPPLARWQFTEPAGPYLSDDGDLPLLDINSAQPTTTVSVSGSRRAVNLLAYRSLYIDAADVGRLHIGGNGETQVSVAAWVRPGGGVAHQWFIAGIWQEIGDNPARQYGLFGSLPGLEMPGRSCMHISRSGGASPDSQFSYDASGCPDPPARTLTWQLFVGTYDGVHIRSYMDGTFTEDTTVTNKASSQRNPYAYPDGLNPNPGAFTVGAVSGKDPVTESSSYLTGRLADLRVWDTALTGAQVADLFTSERAAYGV